MTVEAALWRRFPVRGGGRVVIPLLERRSRRAAVLTDGPFGTRIEVDPARPAELSVYLWGSCVPEVEAAVTMLLGPGGTAVDVASGTGTGLLAAMIAARCRPGRVLAVEPSPEIGGRIAQQARRSGLEANLEVVAGDPLALDGLAELSDVSPDLIRIMANGSEPAVLRGARGLLEAARPALVFDWCPEGWRERGETPGAVAELLTGLGYELLAPALARRARWSVAPPRLERFEPVPAAALAAGTLPGAILIAATQAQALSARLA